MPILLDLTPARESRDYRRLWWGYVVSQIGSQITVVALSYQAFRLHGSSLDVGFVALAQFVPGLIAPLLGGTAADIFNRKLMLYATNSVGLLTAAALAVLAATHRTGLPAILLLAGLLAASTGVDAPTRTTMMINAVRRDQIAAANALRTLTQQIAFAVGPALGGVLIVLGLPMTYTVDAGSYLVVLIAISGVSHQRPHPTKIVYNWQAIAEGWRFVRRDQAVYGCFLADLNATVFGMPESLFPAFATHTLHGGPRMVGLLYASPGIGAVIAALTSGWATRIARYGYGVTGSIIVWGAALIGFGLIRAPLPAVAFLAVAGAANVLSAVFRNTIMQAETPDQLRGRVTSIQTSLAQAGPRLGNSEAGAVAAVAGLETAIVSGAVASIVGMAFLTGLLPRFRRYEFERAPIRPDSAEIVEPYNDEIQ